MSTLFGDFPLFARPEAASSALPSLPPYVDDETRGDAPRGDEPRSEHAPQESEGSDDGGSRRRADAVDLMEGLNPQQRQAVLHEGSPLLIVAGAGSGKTTVLTRRIARLLQTGACRPSEILAITFTNKAAAEMVERITDLVGPRAKAMWISTFHSACVRILRREAKIVGLKSNFSIYDSADALRLVTLCAREADLDPKRFPPKSLMIQISNLKNELIDDEAYAATASDTNPQERAVSEVYRLYTARLRQANAFDFDDLIMTTVNLLRAFPQVAEHYRRRFRHILVDEYQDTNHAQYALVRELVGGHNHQDQADGAESALLPPAELTVVGDADQSIYAFRGATIRNIVEFENDYPDATTILLEQNYRSTQNILSAANSVISQNPDRPAKKLWTDQGAGELIVGYVADSEHDEARFIAEEIDKLCDEGHAAPKDVAIFYRTNAQSRALEEVLVRVGLPYKVVGGTRFYERREIKDALAYLRVLANPTDTVNLRRILNVPKRAIGDRAEAMVAAFAERERIPFSQALRQAEEAPGLATRSLNAIRSFVQLLDDMTTVAQTARPPRVLEAVLEQTGYLAELRASRDPQDESRVENLAELVAVVEDFSRANPEGTLNDFLEQVSLVADADQIPDKDDDGGVVTLMTLHTAKGLEFPVVFVTGLEDGAFPHSRAFTSNAELAEERRLAYVGLTRARKRLYLTRAESRSMWGQPQYNPPSRFLAEVPDSLMDWKRLGNVGASSLSAPVRTQPTFTSPRGGTSAGAGRVQANREVISLEPGEKVSHGSFGLGTVVEVSGVADKAIATVDFGSAGTKRLLLRYAPVEKL
ncbi:DNA helicase PcrA [Saxibacter everestensis]|uniref:ATP-dependent DNA helicase n=1 Tax=Saxibacter everestensis TaxID=2909229 RepID=A0ABY8QPE7_9MICO|nr:DNA helicase PcrA [Brevibacteriaceae bacterium ZFBP1038]